MIYFLCNSSNGWISFKENADLSSTEFITAIRGEPDQFFLNKPWGDQALRKSLVGFFSAGASLPRWQENQYAKSHTSFSSRFPFNGKEWDEETGNFYCGARYYDPKVSVYSWASKF